MAETNNFKELMNRHLDNLQLYVPVVARVHGGTHPEFLQVREVYDEMIKKIIRAGLNVIDEEELKSDFTRLREITHDYKVPEDTCETYEAVYEMLAELDKAY